MRCGWLLVACGCNMCLSSHWATRMRCPPSIFQMLTTGSAHILFLSWGLWPSSQTGRVRSGGVWPQSKIWLRDATQYLARKQMWICMYVGYYGVGHFMGSQCLFWWVHVFYWGRIFSFGLFSLQNSFFKLYGLEFCTLSLSWALGVSFGSWGSVECNGSRHSFNVYLLDWKDCNIYFNNGGIIFSEVHPFR